MKTAVEWLIEEIENHYIINNGRLDPIIVMELKRQAKAMEKEQIIEAFSEGAFGEGAFGQDNISGKQYYNETFKDE